MNVIIPTREPLTTFAALACADVHGLPGVCEVWLDHDGGCVLLHGHPERVCALLATLPTIAGAVTATDDDPTVRAIRGTWGAGTWVPTPRPGTTTESGGPL